MSSGGLAMRLRQVTEKAEFSIPPDFDTSNELHVDNASRALLERFRETNNCETFQLLFEVAHPRLSELAAQITRRLAPAVDSDDLVSRFMARQFSDVRGRQQPVRHFLALAFTSMRNDVLDQLRSQRRAQVNIQRYSRTLTQPTDPAHSIQDDEQNEILGRLGDQVLEITSECFTTLEHRDQQVLIAREIAHLPYDRVAAMLKLAPHQVGMIIRRARMHLADRIVSRLTALAEETEETVSPDGVRVLQDTVLKCLENEDRAKNVQALVEHMLQMSAAAARQKVASLIYEMAKACLVEFPGFADEMVIESRPRRKDIVASDLARIESRLATTQHPVDVTSRVSSAQTATGSALDDARRCLGALEEIEGPSGRQQVASALTYIYEDASDKAETILRELQERDDLEPITRRNVDRNLVLALLRQKHFEEALRCAIEATDAWPDDPALVMNLCTATARLQRPDEFEAYVKQLTLIQQEAPTAKTAAWIDGTLRQLARDVGLDDDAYEALAAPCLANTQEDTRA